MGDRLKEFYRLYDRGNNFAPPLDIVVNSSDIALIARQTGFKSDNNVNNPIIAVWHYDRYANKIKLSYKD